MTVSLSLMLHDCSSHFTLVIQNQQASSTSNTDDVDWLNGKIGLYSLLLLVDFIWVLVVHSHIGQLLDNR